MEDASLAVKAAAAMVNRSDPAPLAPRLSTLLCAPDLRCGCVVAAPPVLRRDHFVSRAADPARGYLPEDVDH